MPVILSSFMLEQILQQQPCNTFRNRLNIKEMILKEPDNSNENEGKETRQDQRIDDKKAQESIRL